MPALPNTHPSTCVSPRRGSPKILMRNKKQMSTSSVVLADLLARVSQLQSQLNYICTLPQTPFPYQPMLVPNPTLMTYAGQTMPPPATQLQLPAPRFADALPPGSLNQRSISFMNQNPSAASPDWRRTKGSTLCADSNVYLLREDTLCPCTVTLKPSRQLLKVSSASVSFRVSLAMVWSVQSQRIVRAIGKRRSRVYHSIRVELGDADAAAHAAGQRRTPRDVIVVCTPDEELRDAILDSLMHVINASNTTAVSIPLDTEPAASYRGGFTVRSSQRKGGCLTCDNSVTESLGGSRQGFQGPSPHSHPHSGGMRQQPGRADAFKFDNGFYSITTQNTNATTTGVSFLPEGDPAVPDSQRVGSMHESLLRGYVYTPVNQSENLITHARGHGHVPSQPPDMAETRGYSSNLTRSVGPVISQLPPAYARGRADPGALPRRGAQSPYEATLITEYEAVIAKQNDIITGLWSILRAVSERGP